ncbi:MAG: type II toxin-antitoxin system Phd/YefM family antitoxin [Oscillospiraceae bacterium]|nr:type II toxin-antitoxin system Phd/YefM family antitoxin [Oscillospiraceae bacterium]
MPIIRPVSDLRNNFTEISNIVHETSLPLFLTKNGYGDMVVMSMEAFDHLKLENEIFFKLKEAENEAKTTTKRYSHEEVFSEIKDMLSDRVRANEV